MAGGGPAYATHVAGLEIWYNAFLYLKFGYAVAMAWLLLHVQDGYSFREIARAAGVPPSTVYYAVNCVLKRLRKSRKVREWAEVEVVRTDGTTDSDRGEQAGVSSENLEEGATDPYGRR